MRHLDHFADREDGAECVRHVCDGDQPGSVVEQPAVLIEQDLAGVVHRDDPQLGAFLGGELLPRHDVGRCSRCGITISSSAPTYSRPQLCATRLIASVVPRTKTTSSGEAAPRKPATVLRAAS